MQGKDIDLQVGYKRKTLSEWRNLSEEDIREMDSSDNAYLLYKTRLMHIIDNIELFLPVDYEYRSK